jgi:hypothetical protein
MTMNHPDITLFGTDESAQRRRMVRDLELFLGNALRQDDPHPNPLPEYREREQEPVYFPPTIAEDPLC